MDADEFVRQWADKIDLDDEVREVIEDGVKGKMLERALRDGGPDAVLEAAIRAGVPFCHPKTGKWHDKSGLGFDSYEDLVRCGDLFILGREFQLR